MSAEVTPLRPTRFQEVASAAATTADQAIDHARRAGIREALDLIKAGKPGLAQYKLTRSVMSQVRMAGGGTIEIPGCPCGGRCGHAGGVR